MDSPASMKMKRVGARIGALEVTKITGRTESVHVDEECKDGTDTLIDWRALQREEKREIKKRNESK